MVLFIFHKKNLIRLSGQNFQTNYADSVANNEKSLLIVDIQMTCNIALSIEDEIVWSL